MSEDLRQQVVEAMARARYEIERRHVKAGWPEWDGLRVFGQKSQRHFAAAALDALLDTLADNADPRWSAQFMVQVLQHSLRSPTSSKPESRSGHGPA